MNRKPPVVAIRGNAVRDVVTQSDLRALSALQSAEFAASRAMQKASLEIEARLAHGAIIEVGNLVFDDDRKMARTRKVKAG
jgi:RNA polymerase-interacting CarD/CdnL/TRCF family regulator